MLATRREGARMRVQELAARIKEAGWPGDPVRFAATLVDEITDPAHGALSRYD